MGYTISKNSIERVRPYLEDMNKTDSDLEWEVENPQKLSYWLREGIKSAEHYKDPDFMHLGGDFRIKVINNNVVAEKRVKLSGVSSSRLVLRDPVTINEVIGACIKFERYEMNFPSASMTDEEIEKMQVWATTKGYTVVGGEGGVIVTKRKI